MYVCTSVRSLSIEELQLRRAALRDAIICIGWIKLLSIFCYVALFIVVNAYSEGACLNFITAMILIIIPLQAITGLLLFLGAVDVKIVPLKVAIWLCLLVAALNTILGLVGAIFFIRTGFNVLHFLIAGYFALLSMSFCKLALPFSVAMLPVFWVRFQMTAMRTSTSTPECFILICTAVLCHDIIITVTFIKLIECPPAIPPDMVAGRPI